MANDIRHCSQGHRISRYSRGNVCPRCGAEMLSDVESTKRERRRQARAARREAYESLGLVRVRGNLGGVYWE